MAKTKTIKTESVEFGIANSARVFTDFDTEKGFSLNGYFTKEENITDYDSMALMVFLCHKSFSKINESDLVFKTKDDLLDVLSITELRESASNAVVLLFNSNPNQEEKESVKKK